MRKYFILILTAIFLIPLSDALVWCVSRLSGTIPSFISGVDTWYVQFLALFIILSLGISLHIWNFNKYLSILNILCLFSVIFVARQTPVSFVHLFQINMSCLAICVISQMNTRQRKIILRTVLVLVAIQGIWVIIQFFNLDPIFNYIKDPLLDDTVGFSGSHNQIGLFFAVTLPVVIASFPWLLPLSIFGLWNSTTTIAWIGASISALILGLFKMRRMIPVILVIMLVCSAVFYFKFDKVNMQIFRERFEVVTISFKAVTSRQLLITRGNAVKILTCNPLFGYGLSNAGRILPYFNTHFVGLHYFKHAHNDYSEAFLEFGYTGSLLITLMLIDLLMKFIRYRRVPEITIYFSCLVAYLVCAVGIFPTHVSVSAMWLILFYGLFEAVAREQKEVYGRITPLGKRSDENLRNLR